MAFRLTNIIAILINIYRTFDIARLDESESGLFADWSNVYGSRSVFHIQLASFSPTPVFEMKNGWTNGANIPIYLFRFDEQSRRVFRILRKETNAEEKVFCHYRNANCWHSYTIFSQQNQKRQHFVNRKILYLYLLFLYFTRCSSTRQCTQTGSQITTTTKTTKTTNKKPKGREEESERSAAAKNTPFLQFSCPSWAQ